MMAGRRRLAEPGAHCWYSSASAVMSWWWGRGWGDVEGREEEEVTPVVIQPDADSDCTTAEEWEEEGRL